MKYAWMALACFGIGWLIGTWLKGPETSQPREQVEITAKTDPALTDKINELVSAMQDYEETLTHAVIADQKQDANCHAVRTELRQQMGQFDQSLMEIHELLEATP